MGVAYVCQILSVFLLSLAGAEPAKQDVQLLTVGEHHGEQVPADAAGLWWGLFPKEDGYELLKVNVSVEIVFDPILDEEGEKSGKLVSIEEKRKPLFLVRGIGSLTEGPVKTFWREPTCRFLYPGESAPIREQETKGVRLTAFGKAEESPFEPGVTRIVDYALTLFSGYGPELRSQELWNIDMVDPDGVPTLLWAGDFDGDGKTDLLMDLRYHYNVTLLTLFLSSRAEPGRLVGKAGEYKTTGC